MTQLNQTNQYEAYLRERLTSLRLEKGVSEHKMSLELGRSGSYIRSITSGIALPSVKELFNIFAYLEVTPTEFFSELEETDTRTKIYEQLRMMDNDKLEKIALFISWLK